ncbi:cupin domain-containing protein [Piscinibacter sp.]|jgi:quercetin dioxygenase-like cupin family protein|uniref:cupin domain-containing protein n=1 Tax=Piscinibacter sp. TaxID=1903157 RepID=UPI002F41BA00
MEDIGRRSALALGLATAATVPALITPTPAFAQRYRPDEGKEVAPGVRRVDLTKRASEIPAYATVSMRDIVYQPGAKSSFPAMPNDMVCHCLEGELQVSQGPGKQFVAKAGDVWSCMKGMPEAGVSSGSTVAIMRVIDLIPPA